jgi:hypothetical protein
MKRLSLACLALVALGFAAPLHAEKFLVGDPLLVDRDDLPVERPGSVELSTAWDVIEHSVSHRPSGRIPPAMNVNTLGEVPDSSWFENRIGAREMSVEELTRGPGRGDGPLMDAKWTVTGGKSEGITPGFTIRDGRGDVYFVKFDPIAYPNLATSADVIATRFFHAFGYSVPEVTLAYFRPEQLEIAPEARIAVRGGKPRALMPEDLKRILDRVPHLPDGRVRCVASKRLAGEALGPHKYFGTRTDDPNDLFPHEHRRELRGYRVFSAWLNHDDSRGLNSLDVYVAEAHLGHVKHHLIDFSSALGAGSDAERNVAPQGLRPGNEYIVDMGPILRTAASFGFWERPWRNVKYEEFPEVGRIEADLFDPDAWKPEYPNPAFERMLAADAFWAARIVARFSDEAVRALVHTGQFTDPVAEKHLADTLIRRRDKIVARYFRSMNPLTEFRLAGAADAPALEFENPAEVAGLGKAEAYEYQWFTLDNRTGRLDPLPSKGETGITSLRLPPGTHSYVMARLRTRSATVPAWQKSVDVYVSKLGGVPRIVGIEREE